MALAMTLKTEGNKLVLGGQRDAGAEDCCIGDDMGQCAFEALVERTDCGPTVVICRRNLD